MEKDDNQLIANLIYHGENFKGEKKVDLIEQLSKYPNSSLAKEFLLKCTKDKSPSVRQSALESLVNFKGDDILKAIGLATKDKNILVRISSVEILGEIGDKNGIPYLIDAIKDSNQLVRRDAAQSLGEIGEPELVEVLIKMLGEEKRNIAKLGYYIGLLLLGEDVYLKNYLNLLKHKSYKVRCSVANSAVYISNKENYNSIVRSLKKALERESTIAARYSIEEAIKELEEIYKVQKVSKKL